MAMRHFPTHQLHCPGACVTSRLLPERARRADRISNTPAMHREAVGSCQAAEAQQAGLGRGSPWAQARVPSLRHCQWRGLSPKAAWGSRMGSAPLPGLGPPFLSEEGQKWPQPVPLAQLSLQGTAAVVPWSLGVLLKSPLNPAPRHMATGCWAAGLGQEQHTKCSGSVLLPGSAGCFKLPSMPWIAVCAMAALKSS